MMYMFNQFNAKTEVVMFNRLVLANPNKYTSYRCIISNTWIKYEMKHEISILVK